MIFDLLLCSGLALPSGALDLRPTPSLRSHTPNDYNGNDHIYAPNDYDGNDHIYTPNEDDNG